MLVVAGCVLLVVCVDWCSLFAVCCFLIVVCSVACVDVLFVVVCGSSVVVGCLLFGN